MFPASREAMLTRVDPTNRWPTKITPADPLTVKRPSTALICRRQDNTDCWYLGFFWTFEH
jgi:hypothetical protein